MRPECTRTPALYMAILACAVLGRAAGSAGDRSMSEIAITRSDADRLVNVGVGQIVSVSLPETPTTGYRWAVEYMDQSLLALQDAQFAAPTQGGIGAPGLRMFRFRVVGAGDTDLVL